MAVLGCSTGYGLATRIAATFAGGADTIGVSLEREPTETRTGSAGWYNNRAFEARADAIGRPALTLEGDAFSDAMKATFIDAVRERFGRLELLIYSVASPVRTDPETVPLYGTVLFKVMKSLGLHEGCVEQIDRLLRTQLGPNADMDEADRLRLDDWELSEKVQVEVRRRGPLLTTETLAELADLAEYRAQFLRLFRFGVEGVDYLLDVDPRRAMG